MNRAMVFLVLGVLGCHAESGGAKAGGDVPKAEPTKVAEPGLASSADVANAYGEAVAKGDVAAGLRLFPPDEVIDKLFTCKAGPSPAKAEMHKQRDALAKMIPEMSKLIVAQKWTPKHVGSGKSETQPKGPSGDCTLNEDLPTKEEFVTFHPDERATIATAQMGGRWYLVHAPG